jgi:hypothetical protein
MSSLRGGGCWIERLLSGSKFGGLKVAFGSISPFRAPISNVGSAAVRRRSWRPIDLPWPADSVEKVDEQYSALMKAANVSSSNAEFASSGSSLIRITNQSACF